MGDFIVLAMKLLLAKKQRKRYHNVKKMVQNDAKNCIFARYYKNLVCEKQAFISDHLTLFISGI